MCMSGNELQTCPHCGGRLIRGPAKDDSDALCADGCLEGPREPLPAIEPRRCPKCSRVLTLEIDLDRLTNPDGHCADCRRLAAIARAKGPTFTPHDMVDFAYRLFGYEPPSRRGA